MVLPLIPIAVAALAGGASAGIAGSLLGTKKGDQITYAPQTADVYHSPYETYQPTTLYAPQQTVTMPSYQVSIGSASSPQTMSTRTDATQQVRQQPDYYQPVSYPTQSSSAGSASEGDGKTLILIALIAAGGLVAYGVLK